jgi:5'(3')-deoxyribonucleotidase
MKRQQILLDMDGVLSDFASGTLSVLNREYHRDVPIEEYATKFGKYEMSEYYGISISDFWKAIENTYHFWLGLNPLPWAVQLYEELSKIGEVTIITSPSEDPNCAKEKLQWLKLHLGIKPKSAFIGSRKHLMAGNGILIDDSIMNVQAFRENGGEAILVPSNWNTVDLTYEKVLNVILDRL